MILSTHVALITSDEQALIVASDLAEDLRRDSAQRDRERRLPLPALDVFSRSGLWGISVPKAYGGAGVSNVTLAKVIALIAQADASLGQIPQNHFYALEVLRVNGSPAQQQRLYAEVLAGQRFGNALAELGTKTAHDRVTRLTRDGDGFRINGRKFYATGAIYAQRIPTSVVDENGIQHLAFVPRDSAGLTVIDDWSGFGQRTTGSGSVVFDNVRVAAHDVLPFQSAFERPTTVGPLAQILHAAIDTGIARLAAAGQGGAGGGRRVRLARLDGLGLPAPWLMKVDVETHEAQVFRGAAAMIAGARPFIVFENWIARGDPQATLRPLRTLEEMGYALYRPCWEFNDGKETFVWPESTPPRPCPRRRLALVCFAAEARFQFGEQINAFACHRDRVAEL